VKLFVAEPCATASQLATVEEDDGDNIPGIIALLSLMSRL